MSRHRNWVFTINNPCESDYEELEDLEDECIYYVWKPEKVDTLHIQGYLQLKNPKGLGGMKKILSRAHLEVARGSPEQAIAYVKKEETTAGEIEEYGEPKLKGGKRGDIVTMKEMLDNGSTIAAVCEEIPHAIRYIKHMREYKLLTDKPRTEQTELHILWGETGAGKSTYAKEQWPDAYWKDNTKWWDGYEGQETVIWDEFDPIDRNMLLRLADHTPFRVEYKGGSVNFNSKRLVLISNDDIREYYNDPALNRRISSERVLWAR